MTFYSIIKAAALPPLSLFLLFLVGTIGRRRFPRLGASLQYTAVGLLYALSTPFVSGWLIYSLESTLQVADGSKSNPQAIVILSADVARFSNAFGGETAGDLTMDRLRFGAALYRQTRLPVLVTGGRFRNMERSLGEIMAEVLESEFNVPVSWIEKESRNTLENAELSARLLEAAPVESVYVVTHAWHMARAIHSFEHAGIGAVPAPIKTRKPSVPPSFADFFPTASGLQSGHLAIYEWLAQIWYCLRYFC